MTASNKAEPSLNARQQECALSMMREFLDAPKDDSGKSPVESDSELDKERLHLIEKELKPLAATSRVAPSLAAFRSSFRTSGRSKITIRGPCTTPTASK